MCTCTNFHDTMAIKKKQFIRNTCVRLRVNRLLDCNARVCIRASGCLHMWPFVCLWCVCVWKCVYGIFQGDTVVPSGMTCPLSPQELLYYFMHVRLNTPLQFRWERSTPHPDKLAFSWKLYMRFFLAISARDITPSRVKITMNVCHCPQA